MSDLNTKKATSHIDNDRRKLLLGAGLAAATLYTGAASAAMKGHDHSMHKPQQPGLLDAVRNCTDKGEVCIAHCLVSFVEGDTELAECASKVHEMHAICDGFTYLLAANSEYINDYAAVCRRVCKDCEEECMKHKEHIECRECGEACAEVVKAIDSSLDMIGDCA